MNTREINAGDNLAMDYLSYQGKVEIVILASCYRNQDKIRTDGSLGWLLYRLSFVILLRSAKRVRKKEEKKPRYLLGKLPFS